MRIIHIMLVPKKKLRLLKESIPTLETYEGTAPVSLMVRPILSPKMIEEIKETERAVEDLEKEWKPQVHYL